MKRIILYLIINFIALAIGGIFTNKGVKSDWYKNLNKAPWTPPGWVFGVAWAIIMITFAFYMGYLWTYPENHSLVVALYVIQFILNIVWNPVFFKLRNVKFGLIVIASLTVLIGFMLVYYFPVLKMESFLLIPYFLWLLIATSLNAYILIKN